MRSIGVPERLVAVGAGLLLAGSIVGAVSELGGDDPVAAPASATEVAIQDFQFGPKELTVAVGDTVTWVNRDSFVHTVAGSDSPPDQSPDLAEGDSYEFTFAEAGTYEYVCTIHVTMRGTITVEGS